jgi:hypothetical protein
MATILRNLELEYDIYYHNTEIYREHKLYKDFKKSPSLYTERNKLFFKIYKNKNNSNHKLIKKYKRIVKYMKNYKKNFNDEYKISSSNAECSNTFNNIHIDSKYILNKYNKQTMDEYEYTDKNIQLTKESLLMFNMIGLKYLCSVRDIKKCNNRIDIINNLVNNISNIRKNTDYNCYELICGLILSDIKCNTKDEILSKCYDNIKTSNICTTCLDKHHYKYYIDDLKSKKNKKHIKLYKYF